MNICMYVCMYIYIYMYKFSKYQCIKCFLLSCYQNRPGQLDDQSVFHCRARSEQLEWLTVFRTEKCSGQGQNLTLTGLFAPNSLDTGTRFSRTLLPRSAIDKDCIIYFENLYVKYFLLSCYKNNNPLVQKQRYFPSFRSRSSSDGYS
jgi:hypothetical protein